MVKSPLLGWGDEDPHGLRAAARQPGKLPDRSVAEFVIDHFGQETLDYLAEPLLSGVYGGDPAPVERRQRAAAFRGNGSDQDGSLGRAVMKAPKPTRPPGGSLFRTLKSGLGIAWSRRSRRRERAPGAAETIERIERG